MIDFYVSKLTSDFRYLKMCQKEVSKEVALNFYEILQSTK